MRLPEEDGTLTSYEPVGVFAYPERAPVPTSRMAYAAAHVVADPLSGADAIDWETTLAFRRHLWDLGLGVAEAMDTAQRGMGLSWPDARRLIELSAAARSGPIVAGASTDQLEPASARSLAQVIDAYLEQCEAIETAGADVVLMASRELCRLARAPEDYVDVYRAVLAGRPRPIILHWLGEMFDPALRGYWGSRTYEGARDTVMAIIAEHGGRVDGIKLSLLDQDREADLRSRLPEGVRMYTGDDFDYPTTIADGSHALLGAFDFAAPAAAWALSALDNGDRAGFVERLTPTLPLSRHVFSAPTAHYKTGVVFLSYLNDYQSHFRMVGGMQNGRSVAHLATVYRLADQAGLLRDGELAAARMQMTLNAAGLEA